MHFLLNNKMGPRHKNKLLAGARILIYTKCAFSVASLSENPALLDVVIHWESNGHIGTFLDTQMSYIGPKSTESCTVSWALPVSILKTGNIGQRRAMRWPSDSMLAARQISGTRKKGQFRYERLPKGGSEVQPNLSAVPSRLLLCVN